MMEDAARSLPSIEYLATLADLYRARGLEVDTEVAIGTVVERLDAYARHGVRPDVDFVLFYADHGIRLHRADRDARALYRQRPTFAVADARAWTAHALGRDHEAWVYARRALRSPTFDASIGYHAGVIAAENGRDRRARHLLALALRTPFALTPAQIADAERLMRQLR